MLNRTYCNRAGITWDTEIAILENTFERVSASRYRVRTALEISQAISNTFRFKLNETEVAVLRNRAIKKMLANGFNLRLFFDIAATVAISGLQQLIPTNASGRAFQRSDLLPFVVDPLNQQSTTEEQSSSITHVQTQPKAAVAGQKPLSKQRPGRVSIRDEFGLTPRQKEVVQSLYSPETGIRSHKEIGRLLSITSATVNLMLTKAREELSNRGLTVKEYLQRVRILTEMAATEVTAQPAKEIHSPTSCETMQAAPMAERIKTRRTDRDTLEIARRQSQRKLETASRQDEFGLNQLQRDTLHLLFTEGGHKRSTSEIAKLLNISSNYVKCTIYTARKALSKHELTIPQYLQKLGLPFEKAPAPARQPKSITDEFGLSNRQRAVLQLLITTEGYKRYPNEIATILHISPSNVYTVLSTARAKLSEQKLTVKDYLQKLGLPCEAQASEKTPQTRQVNPVTTPWLSKTIPPLKQETICKPTQQEMIVKPKQPATISPPKQETIWKPKLPEKINKPKPPAKISKPKQAKPISKPVAVYNNKHKELTSVELITAFQKGNVDAFQTLLQRNKKYILGKMHTTGVDPTFVEEVEQKIHIRIWKSLKTLRDPTKFKPWLSETIKNCWNDELRIMNRSRKRMSFSLDDPLSIDGEQGSARLDLIANTKSQADSAHEFQELEQLIEHAISRMPKVFGEAIRLRALGYRYDEIEQLTNTEAGTVKSRIARGRRFLHDILLKKDPDRYLPVIDAMRTHGFVE